jgi:imidazolonepropionase
MEVHAAGGGINFTVDHTRRASEDELEALLLPRLQRMLRAGEFVNEVHNTLALLTFVT